MAGSAIDEGKSNKVTGLRPVAGGVGQAVSAAVQEASGRSEDLGYGFAE